MFSFIQKTLTTAKKFNFLPSTYKVKENLGIFLKKAARKKRINSLVFKISPLTKNSYPPPSDRILVHSLTMALHFEVADENHFWDFLQYLYENFSGIFSIKELKIYKKHAGSSEIPGSSLVGYCRLEWTNLKKVDTASQPLTDSCKSF